MEEDNELLTVPFAAQEKGVHVKSVYRAIREGRLKAEKQLETVLVRRRELRAWEPNRRIRDARARQQPINEGGPLLRTGSLSKPISVAIHNVF